MVPLLPSALELRLTFYLQINPDAGNLGGKVGFIFLGTGIIAAVGGWYLYPETKVCPPLCHSISIIVHATVKLTRGYS